MARGNLVCLVDWVAVTFVNKTMIVNDYPLFSPVTLEDVYSLIGIPETDFEDMENGLNFYKSRKKCGNIQILYNGEPNMGIHVIFSGQGCRQWETFYANGQTWDDLFELFWNVGGNFTRLDLAIDDICYNDEKPYFKVPKLYKLVEQGLCRSKWRKMKPQWEMKIKDGSIRGVQLEFGKRESDSMLRIYEKNVERENRGYTLDENLTVWNRVELELHDERANQAISHIVNDDYEAGTIVYGVLSNYINFVKNDGTANKSRWPVQKFWIDFLQNAEKLRLASKAPDRTIEEKKHWLNKSVEKTLAMVFHAERIGDDYLHGLVESGTERMTEKDWKKIEDFRSELEAEKIEKELKYERYVSQRNEKIIDFREAMAYRIREEENYNEYYDSMEIENRSERTKEKRDVGSASWNVLEN